MGKQLKAVIFFWEGYLDVAPTLIAFIRLLSSKNVHVTLILSDREETKVIETFDPRLVRVTRINPDRHVGKTISSVINSRIGWKFFPEFVKKVNNRLSGQALDRFARIAGKETGHYDVAYCVDATGLYAFKKSGVTADATINISFEILDLEFGTRDETLVKIKEVERSMMKNEVDHVIIQDRFRAALLNRTLGFTIDNFLYLPNSVEKGNEDIGHGDFFLKKFNLPRDTKLVLSAGMIGEAVCSLAIAEVIGKWNTALPVRVVFHERLAGKTDTPYLERIRRSGGEKLLLSLEPLPYDQLYELFSSASVGLAIYNKEYGDNFGIIGSASGKLFQYIKFGLPVIVSNLPGLADLVRDFDLGEVVESVEDIPRAIEDVFEKYEFYSANAKKAFQDKLNMNIFLEDVWARMYN